MAADYLIVGHVTQDLTPQGLVLGGTALYATVTAQRLGCRVALVTRVPPGVDLQAALPGVALCALPTERATIFENRYRGDEREQIVHGVAPGLSWEDIPEAWRAVPLVHLAPVAQEVAPALAARFPHSLVCATPQGWMRRWDGSGHVRYAPLAEPARALESVDAMVFSAEDVAYDRTAVRALIGAVPIVAVTQAGEGATVHAPEGSRSVPPRPTTVVDPTGAGDVFAAAFFVRLLETRDPYAAAAFANGAASFAIEQPGVEGIPTRSQVEAWHAGMQ